MSQTTKDFVEMKKKRGRGVKVMEKGKKKGV